MANLRTLSRGPQPDMYIPPAYGAPNTLQTRRDMQHLKAGNRNCSGFQLEFTTHPDFIPFHSVLWAMLGALHLRLQITTVMDINSPQRIEASPFRILP